MGGWCCCTSLKKKKKKKKFEKCRQSQNSRRPRVNLTFHTCKFLLPLIPQTCFVYVTHEHLDEFCFSCHIKDVVIFKKRVLLYFEIVCEQEI